MARPREDDGKPADDATPPAAADPRAGDGGGGGDETGEPAIKPGMSTEDLLSEGIAVDVPFETPNAGSGLRYFDDPDTEAPPEWEPDAIFKNGGEAWTAVAAGNMDSSAAAAAQGDGPDDAAAPGDGGPPEPSAPPETPAEGPGKPTPAAEKPAPPAAKK
jgi:hypothetical protein